MTFFSNVTRGGQLQIHQLRMFHQIFSFAFFVSILVSVGFFTITVYKELPSDKSRDAITYAKAKFYLRLGAYKKNDVTQSVTMGDRVVEVKSKHVVRVKRYIEAANYSKKLLKRRGIQALYIMTCSFITIFGIWFTYGRNQKKSDITKGIELVEPEVLAKQLKRENMASDITVEGLPLVKGSETKHIMITGTTGCGKTNLFDIILPQIRKRPNKAIIVDIKGNYVAKYYDPTKDFIFNPFDERSINWDLWSDLRTDSHFEAFAHSIIPDKKNQMDDVWDKSSRIVLVELLKKLGSKGLCDTREVFKVIDDSKINELESFFNNTPASKLICKDAEKTTFSILMNLVSQIAPLKYLNSPQDQGFSIRKWIEDDNSNDSWLFLTARMDQIDSLRTLISSFIDTALNATLSLDRLDSRRLWFIADELPILNKLHSLKKGLTLGRENGCSIMFGIQDIPQLRSIYGYEDAKTILNNVNTHFIFRYQDSTTSKEISEMLGVVEQEKHQETMSYGSSNIKDGVSFSKQTQSKSLVLPVEIANLKVGQAYVKYGGYDITIVKTSLQQIKATNPGFISKKKDVTEGKLEDRSEASCDNN